MEKKRNTLRLFPNEYYTAEFTFKTSSMFNTNKE